MDPNPPTARPAPPARRRGRASAPPTDSADNSPTQPDVGPSFAATDAQEPGSLSTMPQTETERRPSGSGTTTGLLSTQEMEAAFGELAKEDLLLALQRAKDQMDSLEEIVSSQTLEIENLQSGSSDLSARLLASDTENSKLANLVQQREARIDEMNNDQAKLEDEVYSKLGLLERLKMKADEGERKRSEAERKLADALQMADKEREYFQDQEAHLKAANARLASDVHTLKQQRVHLKEVIRNSGREDEESFSSDARSTSDGLDKQSSLAGQALEKQKQASSLLEEELEQLRKTLASQDGALVELRAKLNDERNRSVQLEEDKSELESMLTGNTLEHLMKSKASGQWRTSYQSETTGSASSASRDDTTDATSEGRRPGSEDGSDAANAPHSDVTTTPKPRTAAGSSLPGDEGDTVDEVGNAEKELIRLRQENKRLTTYVTKILNRIMSMEGFERVLAADSLSTDGTRTLRGTLDKPTTPRPTILPFAAGSTSARAASTTEQKKDRRRSSGLLGLSRARSPLLSASPMADDALTVSPTPSNAGLAPVPSQTASRTSSVDWKSLRLPWSSGVEEKTNPNLRPFALSTSSSRLEGPALENRMPSPRLPDLEEEYGDDADELERQRARTLLQMEGLTVPAHQLAPISPTARTFPAPAPAPAPAPGGFTSFLSRMMTTEPAPVGSTSKTGTASAAPASISDAQAKPDLDHSGRLTEASKLQRPRRPTRGDSSSSSAHSLGRSDSSSGHASLIGHSRIDSVAGDESYALAGIVDLDKRDAAEAPAPGWRKALKRMSLMGGPEAPAQQ